MRLAALTACNLNFAPGAIAVLKGLRRFHPEVERFVYVPPAELDKAREHFADLAEVLIPPRVITGVPTRGHYQILVARVFLNNFKHDAVAWLDCDMVVCRPLLGLWDVAPERVRAVMDRSPKIIYVLPPKYHDGFRRAFPGDADRHGFNAGLFAFRPQDWPELPERFEQGLKACGYREDDYPTPFDQLFLNSIWLDRLEPLGIEYNAHCNFDHPIPSSVRVVHFTSTVKP